MDKYPCCCPFCGIKHFSDKPLTVGEKPAFGYMLRGCDRCLDVPAQHREKWIRAATKAYLEKELTATDRKLLEDYGRIR